MHHVELLEHALATARKLGFLVREEYVGDIDGGSCVVRGQKMLFLDPQLSIPDRLMIVCEALAGEEQLDHSGLPEELTQWLTVRKAA
tara:strand:+ start:166 stop:426 length:261 start_codon:yes stop_codon:yes gene_type:complete